MNHIHGTHRLSVTLAGLAAAALTLSACQGTATAASQRPHHHQATQVMTQQAQNGIKQSRPSSGNINTALWSAAGRSRQLGFFN